MHPASRWEPLARRDIDVAVGILVAVRRCSAEDAFREIAAVVRETGIPLGDTALALIAVANPTAAADGPHATHHEEALRIWGGLFDAA